MGHGAAHADFLTADETGQSNDAGDKSGFEALHETNDDFGGGVVTAGGTLDGLPSPVFRLQSFPPWTQMSLS
jgi:hypothetical protein